VVRNIGSAVRPNVLLQNSPDRLWRECFATLDLARRDFVRMPANARLVGWARPSSETLGLVVCSEERGDEEERAQDLGGLGGGPFLYSPQGRGSGPRDNECGAVRGRNLPTEQGGLPLVMS
jgi:hypothetical protein